MAEDYAWCSGLTRDQWAWEFLRRNPDYRADYRRFIAIWRALEADYGAPPQRDFQRWKRDPRAYGPLGEEVPALAGSDLCLGEDDRVLLECWLGAKWGFHKFPLDPHRLTPPGPAELAWRPPPPATPPVLPFRMSIDFDLSLPLAPQLQAAKLRLAGEASALRRQGHAVPRTVANQCARWGRMLEILDCDAAGSGSGEEDTLRRAAKAMVAGGYREILRLDDSALDKQ
jgi:hypothetical protein